MGGELERLCADAPKLFLWGIPERRVVWRRPRLIGRKYRMSGTVGGCSRPNIPRANCRCACILEFIAPSLVCHFVIRILRLRELRDIQI